MRTRRGRAGSRFWRPKLSYKAPASFEISLKGIGTDGWIGLYLPITASMTLLQVQRDKDHVQVQVARGSLPSYHHPQSKTTLLAQIWQRRLIETENQLFPKFCWLPRSVTWICPPVAAGKGPFKSWQGGPLTLMLSVEFGYQLSWACPFFFSK